MKTKTEKETQPETENATQENLFDATAPPTENLTNNVALRQQALKAISMSEIPYASSRDLLGVEFDILNAYRKTIKGEVKIAFVVRRLDNGSEVCVSKDANSFTEPYLNYFETFGEGETPVPIERYTFVETDGGKAGNKPIVLRKV